MSGAFTVTVSCESVSNMNVNLPITVWPDYVVTETSVDEYIVLYENDDWQDKIGCTVTYSLVYESDGTTYSDDWLSIDYSGEIILNTYTPGTETVKI